MRITKTTMKSYKEMVYLPERIKEVLYEGEYNGIKFLILTLGTHPTAYIALPKGHKLYKVDYGDINVSVHCGFTFADNKHPLTKEEDGYYWIGWDYAHAGDFVGWNLRNGMQGLFGEKDKKWTTREIYADVVNVIDQLPKLKRKIKGYYYTT